MTSKETLEKITAHQLQGIMLHADYMAAYTLIGIPKEARRHQRQAQDEMASHIRTLNLYAVEVGYICRPQVHAEPFAFTEDELDSAEFSGLARAALHKRMLENWHKWEVATAELYADVIDEDPDCDMWMRLKAGAEREIKFIEHELNA